MNIYEKKKDKNATTILLFGMKIYTCISSDNGYNKRLLYFIAKNKENNNIQIDIFGICVFKTNMMPIAALLKYLSKKNGDRNGISTARAAPFINIEGQIGNENYDQILAKVSRFMQDNKLTELMKNEIGDAFSIRENVNEIIMLYIDYRLKSTSPESLLKALKQFNSEYGQLSFAHDFFFEIYESHCKEEIFSQIDDNVALYVNTPEHLFRIFDIMASHQIFAAAKKLIINILDNKYSFLPSDVYTDRLLICLDKICAESDYLEKNYLFMKLLFSTYKRTDKLNLFLNNFINVDQKSVYLYKNRYIDKYIDRYIDMYMIDQVNQDNLKRHILNCYIINEFILNMQNGFNRLSMIKLQNKYLTNIIEKNKIYIEVNDRKRKKLAFFCPYEVGSFNFFSPIVKNINPENIDLIFSTTSESIIKSAYSDYLKKFNHSFDIDTISEYEYIMGDYHDLAGYYGGDFNTEQKLIPCLHGTDGWFGNFLLEKSSLCFVQFEKNIINVQNIFFTKFINHVTLKKISTLPQSKKCELFYSGPFHMEDFFTKQNKCSKEYLLEELSENIGSSLNLSRPIIFFMEDEYCFKRDIYNAINYLADYFTVIYKECFPDPDIKSRIKPEIHIIDTCKFAPNLAKLAADYVFAGYCSSTLMTSIFAGIPTIPYFSPMIKQKWLPDFQIQPYFNLLPELTYKSLPCEKVNASYPIRANLNDMSSVKDMLLSGVYKKIFSNFIDSQVKKIFGNFYLQDAAKITAEKIVKFTVNGTLGDEADAFYLKNSYFE